MAILNIKKPNEEKLLKRLLKNVDSEYDEALNIFLSFKKPAGDIVSLINHICSYYRQITSLFFESYEKKILIGIQVDNESLATLRAEIEKIRKNMLRKLESLRNEQNRNQWS